MTQSKQYPEIQKLQNRTLIPYNIQQKQQTDEDGVTTNYYDYGLIKKSLDFQATLENVKTIILDELKSENSQYIRSKYDPGKQQTFQAVYADPNTLAATKTAIESIWAYINSILTYYYTKKSTVKNAATINDIMAVTWDFSGFDDSDPIVELEDIL